MLGRNSFLGWSLTIGALTLIARCSAATAQGASPPPAVTVAPVVSREVRATGDFVGRVTAINKVDIVARVPGYIEQRLFTEGQLVKKATCCSASSRTLTKPLSSSSAPLLPRRKRSRSTPPRNWRAAGRLPKDFVPKATVDQQTAAQQSAQADTLEAQAALDQAQINLGYTEIRSPIDGRIGIANFTVGNLVGPTTNSLATIVSFDPIYVLFQASERDVLDFKRRRCKAARRAAMSASASAARRHALRPARPSRFSRYSGRPQHRHGRGARRIFQSQSLLVPGGIVGVQIQRGAPRTALLIPQSSLQLDQAGPYVLVVDGQNKVEQRRVTLGPERGSAIVIADGLKAGERVIVEGVQKVRPGLTVSASPVPGN